MRQLNPTIALCFVFLLVMCCLQPSEAGRHRHRSNRNRKTGVHIEIFYPQGLLAWYPQRPGMSGFGIEIFMNQKHATDDEAVCDICLNTTEVSYGKYILRSDDAIVRGGDHLMYNAVKIRSNGSANVMHSSEFYVADSRIRRQKMECDASARARSGNQPTNTAMLEEEINLLENVIYDMFLHCNNVTQSSKNLYLNFRPAETRLDSKLLYSYTLNVLKEMFSKIDWEKTLINAFYYEDGIGFEVNTLVDKLKILQMAKNFTQFTVSDLDDLEGDNEIDIYDHTERN